MGCSFKFFRIQIFLAEGTAVQFIASRSHLGWWRPSVEGQKTATALVDVYSNWVPRDKILTTNVWSSELSLTLNAFGCTYRASTCGVQRGANVSEVAKSYWNG
jgi:UDPglucose 6-dehydrogenase